MILIKIPRRKRHCDICKAVFSYTSPYDTVLIEENEGWNRLDYCSKCWSPHLKEGAKSHWRALVPAKNESTAPDENSFLNLVDHLRFFLEKGSNPSQAFILALYLLRKKVLQKRQELEHEGMLVTLYEVKNSDEILVVPHVDITNLDAAQLQNELQALL